MCVARYLVERSPLWPLVIRKLCEQLSLNPYDPRARTKGVGGKRLGKGKKKRADKYRPQLNQ